MSKITVKDNAPFNGANLQNSSPFERRQNLFRQLHNREVREAFADVYDVPSDGTPYDPNKVTPDSSPRKLLRNDLLIEDNDCFSEMWIKRELLEFMTDKDVPVFLPSYDEVAVSVTNKPQVHLYFLERKSEAIIAKRRRVDALVSFRLVEKTITTITKTDISELTREINLAFPQTFKFEKGRNKYSYRDKDNGFQFILTMLNETEAREVITKTMGIIDKTPNFEERLRTSTSEKNYNTTETISILNSIEKLPKQRPVATCYLKSAYLTFGKFKQIDLVTRQV